MISILINIIVILATTMQSKMAPCLLCGNLIRNMLFQEHAPRMYIISGNSLLILNLNARF